MKISVGFICPEPEAAKSPVLVDRQTHAHPNTASKRSRYQFVLNGGPIGEPVVLAGLSFGGHRMEEYLVTLHFGRFVLWLV